MNQGKIGDMAGLTEEFFGFYLAPMFNAVKRMEGSMDDAFGVFFGRDPEKSLQNLFDLNEERKQLVDECFEKLDQNDQPFAPYVYFTGAHKGILGLLAQRKMDEKGHPVMVVREDESEGYRGSGRSPSWYPFLSRTQGQQGVYAAGHEAAFGCHFVSADVLVSFVKFLADDIQTVLAEIEEKIKRGELAAAVEHDLVISTLGDGDSLIDIPVFEEFLQELGYLRPFGNGFPKPSVLLRFRARNGLWSRMGEDQRHLKVTLSDGLVVVGFNQGALFNKVNQQSNVILEASGKLNLNIWNDNRTVQFLGDLEVKDLKHAAARA